MVRMYPRARNGCLDACMVTWVRLRSSKIPLSTWHHRNEIEICFLRALTDVMQLCCFWCICCLQIESRVHATKQQPDAALPEQHKQPNKRGFESSDELGQQGHAYKMRARLVREENHLIHTRACTHPISTSTFERMSQHISILMKFTINTSSSMCTCIAYLYNGQTLATNTGAFSVSFETLKKQIFSVAWTMCMTLMLDGWMRGPYVKYMLRIIYVESNTTKWQR